MKKILLIVLVIFCNKLLVGQAECVSHWTKDGRLNQKLDSILATISFRGVDSLPCAQYGISKPVDYKVHIDFYNEQLGEYFSEASCVNFAKRYYKRADQETYDEVVLVQFELPRRDIKRIKSIYGKGYDGYRYFKMNVLTLYKFVIRNNDIYFISTQSYHPGEKESFLDKVCDVFVESK